MKVRIEPIHLGSTQVEVFRDKNKKPHFVINGAEVEDLDVDKIRFYLQFCCWIDRGSSGYVIPQLVCDDFLKRKV